MPQPSRMITTALRWSRMVTTLPRAADARCTLAVNLRRLCPLLLGGVMACARRDGPVRGQPPLVVTPTVPAGQVKDPAATREQRPTLACAANDVRTACAEIVSPEQLKNASVSVEARRKAHLPNPPD